MRINAADAFTIDSKVDADPDPTDRCVGLDASMDEVRVPTDPDSALLGELEQ